MLKESEQAEGGEAFESALRELQPLAQQGDAGAQYKLGELFSNRAAHALNRGRREEGIAYSKQAAEWYRRAAEQGHAEAEFALGFAHRFQIYGWERFAIPEDASKGATWLRSAAEKGHVNAQYWLGEAFYGGTGVRVDKAEAAKWFGRAGEGGHSSASERLGRMYLFGNGVSKSGTEALKWLCQAANGMNRNAQSLLAMLYYFGWEDIPRDAGAAEMWARRAAEREDADAQWLLGSMYASGHGVPQDFAEALKWLLRAAEQGHAGGMHDLGVMYVNGQGVPRDLVQAYAWYNLAAARETMDELRDENARKRDRVAGKLSRQQLARAQRLTRELDKRIPFPFEEHLKRGVEWSLSRQGVRLPVPSETPGPKPSGDRKAPPGKSASVPPRVADAPKTEQKKPTKHSIASGLVVSAEGLVVTNHHVVEGCREIRIAPGGLAERVATDSQIDLALLKTSQKSTKPAAFREGRGIRPGDTIVVAGFPLQGLLTSDLNITTGTVSALAGPGDDRRLLQITAAVQPGNSGGPLLDLSGNVVGVVVGKLDALKVARRTGDIPQNVSFAISAGIIRAFLDAQGVAYKTGPSSATLSPADVAARARDFTVLVECWK